MANKSDPQKPPSRNIDLSELILQDNDQPNFLKQMQEDFKDLMSDKQVLRKCIETFLDEIVNQLTLGIIFDLHRKFKTGAYCLEVKGNDEEEEGEESEEFSLSPVKNSPQKCVCPNCDQQVAALRFARHLAKCMGVSENSRASRNASRRAATSKETGESSSVSYSANSDDEDDEDWNPRKNRKKDKNVTPKKKGTPKKSPDPDLAEITAAEVEDAIDKATILRHMTRSNSSSPDSSPGSGNTTPKKRDKFKKKSRGKEGTSCSTSLNFD